LRALNAELLVYNGNSEWYYTPYLRDGGKGHKVGWDPALFQFPCKCCGSEQHGLFHHKLDKIGLYEEARIKCPVVAYGDVYDIMSEMLMSRKYRPDPNRLAQLHGHDPNEIPAAISLLRRQGAGRHMFEDQLVKLEHEATQICYEIRSGWTFKRMISNEDEYSELDIIETQ